MPSRACRCTSPRRRSPCGAATSPTRAVPPTADGPSSAIPRTGSSPRERRRPRSRSKPLPRPRPGSAATWPDWPRREIGPVRSSGRPRRSCASMESIPYSARDDWPTPGWPRPGPIAAGWTPVTIRLPGRPSPRRGPPCTSRMRRPVPDGGKPRLSSDQAPAGRAGPTHEGRSSPQRRSRSNWVRCRCCGSCATSPVGRSSSCPETSRSAWPRSLTGRATSSRSWRRWRRPSRYRSAKVQNSC